MCQYFNQQEGEQRKKGICQGRHPGNCTSLCCSYPIGQNLVTRPYLVPREEGKYSLYSGKVLAQLKIQSSGKLKGREKLIWQGVVSISIVVPFGM